LSNGTNEPLRRELAARHARNARSESEAVSVHVREVTGLDPRDVGRFADDYASEPFSFEASIQGRDNQLERATQYLHEGERSTVGASA